MMKIFTIFAVFFLNIFFPLDVNAQVTQPVPPPAPVFGSYLAGYGCLYTFSGKCEVALLSPLSPAVMQANTGSVLGFSDYLSSRYGTSSVGGQFNNMHYLPTLGAYANSSGVPPSIPNPNPARYTGKTDTISDANIFAIARYRYNGPYTTQLSLSALLETEIYLPNKDARLGHSMMRIGVFDDNHYDYSVDGICPLISNSLGCHSRIVPISQLDISLSSTGRRTLEILYTVAPGQEFYVGAFLDASVCCSGLVDSSHTMTMQFSDTTYLELLAIPGAPISAVDEPPASMLVGIGLLFLLLIRVKSRMRQMENSASQTKPDLFRGIQFTSQC
jgi:hypothetical protein